MNNDVKAAPNEAATTCRIIVQKLKDLGFEDAKISHYRKEGLPFAVEVGYVYGECTVRMNALNGAVDTGTVDTIRGVGPKFAQDAVAYLKDCVNLRYIVDPINHGFEGTR